MIKRDIPKRTHTGVFRTTNATNKKYLACDFNHRCAYCDDLDSIGGGYRTYHVEHFAPKEKFPELINTYDNLLFSCPYCNGSKSDDWPSENSNISFVGNAGYIDPCLDEYYVHLDRDEKTGEIIYKTNLGQYMYEHLQLYLKRHSLIFMVDKLKEKRDELNDFITFERTCGRDTTKYDKILHAIDDEFFEYFSLLNQEQST